MTIERLPPLGRTGGEQRPRLLFLSHRLPFPPHSGAAIRTYNILRELARTYEIDAVCFDRRDPATTSRSREERIEALRPFARCDVFPIPQERSLSRLAWDHLRSLVTGRVYTWYVHDDPGFLDRVDALLRAHEYDVIHVDSLDLVRAFDRLPMARVACTHHNIESELLRRRALRTPDGMRRRYLSHQAERLELAERRWAPRVGLNLCCSADDAALLGQLAPGSRIAVVPNGVDDEYFAPCSVPRDGSLVFVGGTTWYPNKDALEWCASEILPALRASGLMAEFRWVGRVRDEERRALEHVPGLTLTGYVDDVRPFLASASIFVAPIRVGGGTRLKILDAWAMGTPIVGTAAAMEGLSAADGRDFLRAETAEAFVSAIRRLLMDPATAETIGGNGRSTVEEHYGWQRIGMEIREHYARLAQDAPPLRTR